MLTLIVCCIMGLQPIDCFYMIIVPTEVHLMFPFSLILIIFLVSSLCRLHTHIFHVLYTSCLGFVVQLFILTATYGYPPFLSLFLYLLDSAKIYSSTHLIIPSVHHAQLLIFSIHYGKFR